MATGVKEQKYTGMFAMTERGHGSNVRGIQTEATFDLSAQEFVIHNPCEDAQKMYIRNAMLGNYAAVFAQLTLGGRSQGPHCFIVPVRDESGRLYPGVTVIDMMYKLGLTVAICYSHRYAGVLLDEDVFQGKELVGRHPLQALVAGLKAYSTWENIRCLQGCRECTGGMGYMMENRIAGLKCDTDVFVTSESDNVVMLQVVTKKEDFFKAWNSCLHHVSSLSLAHIHRVTLTQFSLAVRRCPDRGDQALLMKFCLLYGTKLVFQERAWYLEHKYLTPEASTRIRSQLLDLCDSVKDDALRVISAFNIPHTSLHAPIAGITNPLAAWAFYPAPRQPGVREGERS